MMVFSGRLLTGVTVKHNVLALDYKVKDILSVSSNLLNRMLSSQP